MTQFRFKDLSIGDTFDWISPDTMRNSFFLPCKKISARRYQAINHGMIYTVGSIHAYVYHCDEHDETL